MSVETPSKQDEFGAEAERAATRCRAPKSVVIQSAQFVQAYWRRLLGVSAVILAPCFWHRIVVATDIGSHLYNAWLAQLIGHGQAPGLWIAHQWTNVLFDVLLTKLLGIFSFGTTEKIATAICVLIFFWGAFSLVCAASGKPPWHLLPCLAVIAYGYTFHMGFFNYYLSIGLAFFSLAIFWRGHGWERSIALPLIPLVTAAHPFGLIWVAAAAAYIVLTGTIRRRFWFAPVAIAAILIGAVRWYIQSHSIVEAEPSALYLFNGTDQLLLFGNRYFIPAVALGTFVVIAVAVDMICRRRDDTLWAEYGTLLQLYFVTELAIVLFPRGIRFPGHVAIALITERLTSISAVVACCVLGVMRPKKWHLAASMAIAAVFFSFVYRDTAGINQIEAQAERLVRTLPRDQRVLGTIEAPDDWRILIQHNLERACVGYCFAYGNYEPGSAVFRVRATPGNPYVIDDYDTATDTEEGDYEVQPEDLPIYQVYQCDESGRVLCLAALRAGEKNDRLGVHPDD